MDLYKQKLSSLPNVGAKRVELLEKLGIHSVGGLLTYFPRAYTDLSEPCLVAAAPFDVPCAVRVEILEKLAPEQHREHTVFKLLARDASAPLEIDYFNARYVVQSIEIGKTYLFYGRVRGWLTGRLMTSPELFDPEKTPPLAARYGLTKGINNRLMCRLIEQALGWVDQYAETLDSRVRERYRLPGVADALRGIHRPQSREMLAQARRRLMFEELYTLAAGVLMLRMRTRVYVSEPMPKKDMRPFYEALPFQPTGAQRRAIADICGDLQGEHPANRLVQGDVGSGKTAVAAAAAYYTYLCGGQSALMAPTELLARQHYEGLRTLLGDRLGMRLALLTGSLTASRKREIYKALEEGTIDLCIGTHALLSQGVHFVNLKLVITDEQHRFGVAQRAQLGRKGDERPHTLVMSATPIPRTLALMVYGELDVSVLDELPPGRQPVLTYKISSSKRARAFGFIRRHLQQGLQAYIVCPLVGNDEENFDETQDPQLKAAAAYAKELREGPFKGFQVGLLHGKMKAKEKESVMEAFAGGEIQVLVSTTVIEVGVDVPNAVFMLVENAERFGLSQLHQLRGRVGRGTAQSYCMLLSDSASPEVRDRLHFLCTCTDGFQLAEYDLRTRGPGNFLGRQQHGLPALRLAGLSDNMEMLRAARESVGEVLATDPALEEAEHRALLDAVARLFEATGERLN